MNIKIKQFSTILLTICAFMLAATAINSCTTNPCKDIVCKNNGTCREGKCVCASGYEGPFCANKVSDKFIGYFDGFVRKNGDAPVNLTMIIAPGASNTQVVLYDLYKTYVKAPINGNVFEVVKFDVPLQQIGVNSYKGYGSVETDKYLYFWYQFVNNAGTLDTYYFEGTKRIKP
jgi:EGF-like domain